MEHKMKLYQKSFQEVLDGTQRINVRLNDEKRQQLQLEDIIIFSKSDEPEKTIRVVVTGLLKFISFWDLFKTVDQQLTGGDSKTPEKKVIEISEIYHYRGDSEKEILGILFEIEE